MAKGAACAVRPCRVFQACRLPSAGHASGGSTRMSTTLSMTQSLALGHSRAYCEQLTKAKAKNFYYGLKLLPEPKRSAMFALYAYMRLVDDIADEEDGRSTAQRLDDLESWRRQTHASLAGEGVGDHAIWPAF